MEINVKFVNIIILGISFMLIFTAFQTGGMIQQTIVSSIREEGNKDFKGDGYISLCVVYASFALANWIAPFILTLLGPKITMVIGALTYCLFIANFLYPMTWLFYLLSVVVGFGAAIIWTAQGNFLTINSDDETMSRNSGVFWAIFQCSLLFGNLFVYFVFRGETVIKKPTRMLTYGVLTGVGILGTLLFFTLRGGGRERTRAIRLSDLQKSLKSSFRLFITPRMALLSLAFFYTGLELSFFSGVYTTVVGNTNALDSEGKSKQFIGIAGMLIGAGEIFGGALFGLLGSKTIRFGRDPIVILGYICHMIAFFLIFINFPANASSEGTTDPAYITSALWIALLCSFLLGFGDACFNTQLYSIIGVVYSQDSAPAFSLFKFTQSVSAAIAFLYSSALNLHIQVLILAVVGSIGTVAFATVEWSAHAESTDYAQNASRSDSPHRNGNRNGDRKEF